MNPMNEQPPKVPTASKVVYQNPWITIHEDETITPDGSKGMYGYMESKDSVMVVVLDEQQRVFLVRAYKYPSNSWGWELPGGGGDGEHLLDASKRELEEETEIRADSWELLGKHYVCNGLMTEQMATYLARGHHADGQREQSDETFAAMRFFSLEEIDAMIAQGDINDCQTMTALHLLKVKLANG